MSYSFSSLFYICFIILSFCQPLTASKRSSVSNAFESPYNDEIKCYALPYGGFGFASHILTYYAMTMIYCGRRPLAPWTRLRGPRARNICLAITKMIFTIIPSVVTMARCSHSWCVWYTFLSVCNNTWCTECLRFFFENVYF